MRILIFVLVFFSGILNGSHHHRNQIDKQQQSISNEIFNSQELRLLYNLVNIFDQIVYEGDGSGRYNEEYLRYMDSLRASDLANLTRDFSDPNVKNQLRTTVRKLKKNDLFSEIWEDGEMLRLVGGPNKPFSRDSVAIWEINTQGKYAEFLSMMGRNYPVIKQYDNIILREGGLIGPGVMAIMLGRDENTLNFEDKSVRLIFAIHWITYLSQFDESIISKLEK